MIIFKMGESHQLILTIFSTIVSNFILLKIFFQLHKHQHLQTRNPFFLISSTTTKKRKKTSTPQSIMDPNFAGKPIAAASHHRRSQSETFFRFPDDDILLDDVVADFNFANIDLPSFSSDAPGDSSSKSEGESSDVVKSTASRPPGLVNHTRSLSVDADFFNGLGFSHRRSDGSAASSYEGDSTMMMVVDNSKKALAPDKLAELALIDPKRAKRFNLFICLLFDFWGFCCIGLELD